AAAPSATSGAGDGSAAASSAGGGRGGVLTSAALSQVSVLAGDDFADTRHFPAGVVDVNAQQLDLRSRNSWMLRMEVRAVGDGRPSVCRAIGRSNRIPAKPLCGLCIVCTTSWLTAAAPFG